MSSRWYPIYAKGNPQLRIFLPNFWMKLVKPDRNMPPNIVTFQTSTEMTHHDVKNYLQKIYNIDIVEANVEIKQGKTRMTKKNYVVKDDDYKVATVTLPRDTKFEFPDLFPKKDKDEMEEMKEMEKNYTNFQRRRFNRPGVPEWYSI